MTIASIITPGGTYAQGTVIRRHDNGTVTIKTGKTTTATGKPVNDVRREWADIIGDDTSHKFPGAPSPLVTKGFSISTKRGTFVGEADLIRFWLAKMEDDRSLWDEYREWRDVQDD